MPAPGGNGIAMLPNGTTSPTKHPLSKAQEGARHSETAPTIIHVQFPAELLISSGNLHGREAPAESRVAPRAVGSTDWSRALVLDVLGWIDPFQNFYLCSLQWSSPSPEDIEKVEAQYQISC